VKGKRSQDNCKARHDIYHRLKFRLTDEKMIISSSRSQQMNAIFGCVTQPKIAFITQPA